jgi:hypothetical protein
MEKKTGIDGAGEGDNNSIPPLLIDVHTCKSNKTNLQFGTQRIYLFNGKKNATVFRDGKE